MRGELSLVGQFPVGVSACAVWGFCCTVNQTSQRFRDAKVLSRNPWIIPGITDKSTYTVCTTHSRKKSHQLLHFALTLNFIWGLLHKISRFKTYLRLLTGRYV